jgi:hypothetical protein
MLSAVSLGEDLGGARQIGVLCPGRDVTCPAGQGCGRGGHPVILFWLRRWLGVRGVPWFIWKPGGWGAMGASVSPRVRVLRHMQSSLQTSGFPEGHRDTRCPHTCAMKPRALPQPRPVTHGDTWAGVAVAQTDRAGGLDT